MIDTAEKRRSAVCTRRLPWMRRFLPAPDGAMTQADRQQAAFVYSGILASPLATTVTIVGAWTDVVMTVAEGAPNAVQTDRVVVVLEGTPR